uniref:Putative glycosyltransferase n=1 Tax=viral metagenome TaxID=1070528 RepID=A0A6M3JZK5_9ZZZZ
MKPKILFGPCSMGGLNITLANHLKKRGYQANVLGMFKDYLGSQPDYQYLRPDEILALALDHDVIVLDFGNSLLHYPSMGIPNQGELYKDILQLREAGKIVFMWFHGSDVRSQSMLHSFYWEHMNIEPPHLVPKQTLVQYQRVKKLDELCHGFLFTRHTLELVPHAVPLWEIFLNLEDWPWTRMSTPKEPRKVILSTTSARKKNQDILRKAVDGKFEIVDISGIPRSQVRERYLEGDFLLGQANDNYGLTEIECMALGIPVVVGMKYYENCIRNIAPVLGFCWDGDLGECLHDMEGGEISPTTVLRARRFVETYHTVGLMANLLLGYIQEALDGQQVSRVRNPDWREPDNFEYWDWSIPRWIEMGEKERARVECVEAVQCGYKADHHLDLLRGELS